MDLIGLIILLIIVGVALSFIPMEARIKQIIIAVIAIFVLLWLLQGFGGHFGNSRFGR